jgi:hypothetical protein
MHNIYLGYSLTLTAREMKNYFDIDINHPESKSKFEQIFEVGYIEPGTFEVYGSTDYENLAFDESLISELLPFRPQMEWLEKIDYINCKCVFYIATETTNKMSAENVTLLGPFRIIRFDFE